MPDTALMRAYPYSAHKTATVAGAAIIHMIMNNLDRRVAQFPEELVTYGGNGQVGYLISVCYHLECRTVGTYLHSQGHFT